MFDLDISCFPCSESVKLKVPRVLSPEQEAKKAESAAKQEAEKARKIAGAEKSASERISSVENDMDEMRSNYEKAKAALKIIAAYKAKPEDPGKIYTVLNDASPEQAEFVSKLISDYARESPKWTVEKNGEYLEMVSKHAIECIDAGYHELAVELVGGFPDVVKNNCYIAWKAMNNWVKVTADEKLIVLIVEAIYDAGTFSRDFYNYYEETVDW